MANSDLTHAMKKCALFQDLNDKELRQVADQMSEDHFPGKTAILKEGEQGMGFFFVVLDGQAVVNQRGNEVATLKTGDFFGEITSLQGGPRTASVTTVEPLWVLRLTDSGFRPFLEKHPKITFRILEKVCTRFQALATNAGS
ncbi:MAG: cyclic nucleotide-binding domain-containing protein [Candidatus Dormibacteria bacterium]